MKELCPRMTLIGPIFADSFERKTEVHSAKARPQMAAPFFQARLSPSLRNNPK
jgi:hypothetical protein